MTTAQRAGRHQIPRAFMALLTALALVGGLALGSSPARATTHPVDVLCHTSAASMCTRVLSISSATTFETWTDAQFQSASVADFQRFGLIFLGDGFSNQAATSARDVYGAAITGRAVLSGVHFEHAFGTNPAAIALRDSIDWVLGDPATGIVVSTQYGSSGPNWIPTIAPFNGVTYSRNGGGYDTVRVDDPGHATMQGSTSASLSNFGNSSHSIWGDIGGFTSVASICDRSGYYQGGDPGAECAGRGGTMRPHVLVTSVGVADQDGDGVSDNTDNCATISNPGQEDANNNGVGDACESAPTVDIDPDAVTVTPGGAVTFTTTATDSDDPLSSLTYEWRVNGIVQAGETGDTFTSTFAADSTVRVTVRDPGLLSGFDEAEVTIASNRPPTVSATGDDVDENGTATIEVTADDPDGDPMTLTINWADGSSDTATVGNGTHPFDHQYLDDDPTGTLADTYTVSIGATDGDASVSTSTAVSVANVAPAVADPGPANVDEGTSLPLSTTFSDVGTLDTHEGSIAWGDGSPDSGALSGSTVSGSHTYDDNGNYNAVITVEDDDTGSTQQAVAIAVGNVAPQAAFTDDGPVDEGTSFQLALTDPSDPSDADTTAGFEHRFDCDDSNGFTAWSLSNTVTCATDDNGVRNVVGQIRDKDGGKTGYSGTVSVSNVAPEVEAGPNHDVTFGGTATLDADFDDPGADADWTIDVTWGDGSSGTSAASSTGALSPSQQYLTLGEHTVTLCVTDKDGAQTCDTTAVTVSNTRGKITGGFTTDAGGRGGFNAQTKGSVKGSLQYQAPDERFHANDVHALAVSEDATSAWFAGTGKDGRSFVAYVEDNGEPSRADVLRLWIDGVLQPGDFTRGNIQIHSK